SVTENVNGLRAVVDGDVPPPNNSETFTRSEGSASSYTVYHGGSFAQGRLSLDNVSIRQSGSNSLSVSDALSRSVNGSSSASYTSSGRATADSHTGSYSASGSSSLDYSSSLALNATASASSSFSLSMAGSYANGSYNLSSVVNNVQGQSGYST